LEEVAAGLYTLPWQEAKNEQAALTEAVKQSGDQKAALEEMFASPNTANRYSSLLSDTGINNYIASSAQLAKDSTGQLKPQVSSGTNVTTTYRINLDYATWVQALATINVSAPQLKGRLETADAKEAYLRKDIVFRSHRAAISRQLVYLQLQEQCRPNSIINYSERLERQRDLFGANLIALIQRAKMISEALKKYYNIDVALDPPPTGQILDRISVWLVGVQDELARFKRGNRLFLRSVWNNGTLSQLARTSTDVADKFQATVVVDNSVLSEKGVLLRGVALEFIGQNNRPVSLEVRAPSGAYVARGDNDALSFGRVCQYSPSADPKPQYPDVLWNGAPFGEWTIVGSFDAAVGSVDALVMHLWLVAI